MTDIVQVFSHFNDSTAGVSGSVSVKWKGGDGWILIPTGTFVATAQMVAGWNATEQPWVTAGASTNLPLSPINATGVFAFSAPEGFLQFAVDLSGGGGPSVSNLTVFVVAIP